MKNKNKNNIEEKVSDMDILKEDLITKGAKPMKFDDYFSLKLKEKILIYAPMGNGRYYIRNEIKIEDNVKNEIEIKNKKNFACGYSYIEAIIENYCPDCKETTKWDFNRYVGIAPCHGGICDIPVYQCRGCDSQNILKNLKEYEEAHLKTKMKGGIKIK